MDFPYLEGVPLLCGRHGLRGQRLGVREVIVRDVAVGVAPEGVVHLGGG